MAVYIIPPAYPNTYVRHIEIQNPRGRIGNIERPPSCREAEITGDEITIIDCHDVNLDGRCLKTHVLFRKGQRAVPVAPVEIHDVPDTKEDILFSSPDK